MSHVIIPSGVQLKHIALVRHIVSQAEAMLKNRANLWRDRKKPMVTLAQRQKWAHLDPALTFENFRVTAAKQAAIETVKAFLADPLKYSPLIIVGPKGSGKTHLLHAIGNTLAATDPKLRIRCQTTKDFCNHHSKFIRKRRYSDYYRYYLGLNAALTDDIQAVQDDEDAQESLFLTMGALVELGKWVAFACDTDPLGTRWSLEYAEQLFLCGTKAVV